MSSILLIDDEQEPLRELEREVRSALKGVDVITWLPKRADGEGFEYFEKLRTEHEPRLVATDYNLTTEGMGGLYGSTIVDWCQQNLIPAADFSRRIRNRLPEEAKLFELRISTDPREAAQQLASYWRGFERIRSDFEDVEGVREPFEHVRSPAAALSRVLKGTHDESLFALYATGYGGANSALLDEIRKTMSPDVVPEVARKRALLTYICGHVLINGVLKFPGPIIHANALAAHCGVASAASAEVGELFSACEYEGPFSELGRYYWFDCVQARLEEWGDPMEAALAALNAETIGEMNRAIIEARLKRLLPRHECTRCHGRNGGFWCPLSLRPVCLRADCSVAATSWIPRGAQLCRIERDFYEEWAPILGA